eukprot:CAMPEP_0197451788 /NCGR_PEP_ID=MMETSP1175-20131217/30129_1 /TAXON_ID=1003142 /ORGANISM="Triceratium dubium, Strain CCMP147" /LENGTH=162 /DNA_ID=CAMNT_0042984623 /DNA_START=262 /DNA_END=747 /DNA_ORIENTATION=+
MAANPTSLSHAAACQGPEGEELPLEGDSVRLEVPDGVVGKVWHRSQRRNSEGASSLLLADPSSRSGAALSVISAANRPIVGPILILLLTRPLPLQLLVLVADYDLTGPSGGFSRIAYVGRAHHSNNTVGTNTPPLLKIDQNVEETAIVIVVVAALPEKNGTG